jgi:hypothetical protein
MGRWRTLCTRTWCVYGTQYNAYVSSRCMPDSHLGRKPSWRSGGFGLEIIVQGRSDAGTAGDCLDRVGQVREACVAVASACEASVAGREVPSRIKHRFENVGISEATIRRARGWRGLRSAGYANEVRVPAFVLQPLYRIFNALFAKHMHLQTKGGRSSRGETRGHRFKNLTQQKIGQMPLLLELEKKYVHMLVDMPI